MIAVLGPGRIRVGPTINHPIPKLTGGKEEVELMRPTRRQRVIPVRVHMSAIPVRARTALKPRLTGRTERTTDLEPVRRQPRPHRHAPRTQDVLGRVGVQIQITPDQHKIRRAALEHHNQVGDRPMQRCLHIPVPAPLDRIPDPVQTDTVSRRPAASLTHPTENWPGWLHANSPSTTCINSVGTSGTGLDHPWQPQPTPSADASPEPNRHSPDRTEALLVWQANPNW